MMIMPRHWSHLLAALLIIAAPVTAQERDQTLDPARHHTMIPKLPPAGASLPVSPDFVSFSIEYSSFPSYAGNKSYPNLLSATLLNNIAQAQGARPVIRVGGQSQDRALLAGYIDTAFNESYVAIAEDDILPFGRPFWESYTTFPRTRYIHGLNFAKSGEGFRRTLRGAMISACEALRHGPDLSWEVGNEPDMYGTNTEIDAQGRRRVVRSGTWEESAYVGEWKEAQRDLRRSLAVSCPERTASNAWRVVGPSFSVASGRLDAWKAWNGGLRQEAVVSEFSGHFYATNSTNAQSLSTSAMLNHQHLAQALQPTIQLAQRIISENVPFILSETNFARPDRVFVAADTFASSLYTLNFALYSAANNVTRIHLHQKTDAFGSAWQPSDTSASRKGVRPAYYGAMAAATFISRGVRIAQVDTSRSGNQNVTAYAAYDGSELKRVMFINLAPQQVEHYFTASLRCSGNGELHRLTAPSLDSTDKISWNSFQYGADGRPARVSGAQEERMQVRNLGSMQISMPAAGAVMIELSCDAVLKEKPFAQ